MADQGHGSCPHPRRGTVLAISTPTVHRRKPPARSVRLTPACAPTSTGGRSVLHAPVVTPSASMIIITMSFFGGRRRARPSRVPRRSPVTSVRLVGVGQGGAGRGCEDLAARQPLPPQPIKSPPCTGRAEPRTTSRTAQAQAWRTLLPAQLAHGQACRQPLTRSRVPCPPQVFRSPMGSSGTDADRVRTACLHRG